MQAWGRRSPTRDGGAHVTNLDDAVHLYTTGFGLDLHVDDHLGGTGLTALAPRSGPRTTPCAITSIPRWDPPTASAGSAMDVGRALRAARAVPGGGSASATGAGDGERSVRRRLGRPASRSACGSVTLQADGLFSSAERAGIRRAGPGSVDADRASTRGRHRQRRSRSSRGVVRPAPARPHTAAIHTFLRALRRAGFTGARYWPLGGELGGGRLRVFWAEMVKTADPRPPDGLGWVPVRT